jgi:hypothetical protein
MNRPFQGERAGENGLSADDQRLGSGEKSGDALNHWIDRGRSLTGANTLSVQHQIATSGPQKTVEMFVPRNKLFVDVGAGGCEIPSQWTHGLDGDGRSRCNSKGQFALIGKAGQVGQAGQGHIALLSDDPLS